MAILQLDLSLNRFSLFSFPVNRNRSSLTPFSLPIHWRDLLSNLSSIHWPLMDYVLFEQLIKKNKKIINKIVIMKFKTVLGELQIIKNAIDFL